MTTANPKLPVILVVEDDYLHREGLAYLLERSGFAPTAVRTAEEGIAHLTAGLRPEVILLDLTLPGMDGTEFRRAQLATPEWSRIPVVIVSAAPDIDEAARALQAAAWVKKPLVLANFLTTIRLALGSGAGREVA